MTPEVPRARSIRTYLVLIAVVSALPLAILVGRAGFVAYNTEMARASLQASLLAEVTAASAVHLLENGQAVLEGTVAIASDDLRDPGECRTALRRAAATAPFFINLVVADDSGILRCSQRDMHPDSVFSVAHRDWYQAIASGAPFTIGAPTQGSITNQWVVALAVPILDADSTLVGSLAASLPLVQFQSMLTGARIAENELVTISNRDRVVLARSQAPEEHVGKVLPPDDAEEEEYAPGRAIASGADLAGIERTWSQVDLDMGWTVYAGIPTDEIRGPARALLTRSAIIGFFIMLTAGVLVWLIERSITGSLRRVVDSTRLAGSGASAIGAVGGPSEVQALARELENSFAARDKAESAERAVKEKYRSIVDQAVFGIAITTEDGRIREVNPALAAMLGYESPAALMGKMARELYAEPADRDRLVDSYAASPVVRNLELRWLRRDRTGITVRLNGRRVTLEDGTQGFETIVEDVTGQKELQEAFRQSQKMEAVGRLAGGIAHDFNNLLTVVAGNTEFLLSDLPEDDPRRVELTEIDSATTRAAELTQQLLAFSRKSPVNLQPIDVNGLLRRIQSIVMRLIGEHIEVEAHLAENLKAVRADSAQLEQVVINLCVNARDAMPEGGSLVIETECVDQAPAELRLPLSRTGWVRISVEDTGFGISPEVRERIFEPFFTTKPSGEGTGLGLATSYAVVDGLGGVLTVSSIENVGSRFEVWLPAVEAAAMSPIDAAAADAPVGNECVLVIEDEVALRRFIERVLQSAGYSVLLAEDGEEGLEVFQANHDEIDLVLTDVVMPKRSGTDLAREIRATHPGTQILFMSGYMADLPVKDLIGDDPELLMQKPFTISDLLFHVRRVLDRQHVD